MSDVDTDSLPPGIVDINPSNNTASVTTMVVGVPQVADLSVTKTGPATANPGDTITYSSGTLSIPD